MRRLLLFVLGLFVLVGAPRAVEAIPMVITLDKLRTEAPTVVVATFLGPVGPKGAETGYDLLVERSLQGTVKLGPLRVLRSKIGGAYLTPATRIVAFIDKGNALGWVGLLEKGTTLEDGVIVMHGLVDINAYGVSPSRVTLKQLESFLKTGTLTYDFEGALWFPSPKGPVASTITLKVHHDYTASTSTVSGMPTMKGFPATPKVLATNAFLGNVVTVTWVDTLGRPLRLAGEALSVKASGAMETKFFADMPGSLTETEFRAYVADPKLNRPYHEVALALADGTKWKLQLGREVGHVGELTSPTGGKTELGTLSLAPKRTLDAGALQLELDPPAAGFSLLGRPWVTEMLVQELVFGAIPCTATKKGATKPIACTLTLSKTLYALP
jgi:hypothetical protein